MEEINNKDTNMSKIVKDLIVAGYIIFEEVDEELVLEYKSINGDIDRTNDNNIAYSITLNVTNVE